MEREKGNEGVRPHGKRLTTYGQDENILGHLYINDDKNTLYRMGDAI